MEFKDISYIIAVAEEKTITQAARSLFISQPALSQAIRRLEKELGVKLFLRTGNAMQLTSFGKLLVEDGRRLLAERESVLLGLSRLSDGQREVLRFGISPFYSKYFLPGLFQYYAQNQPGIKLEVIERISIELENLVAAGSLDFCFVPAFPAHPDLMYRSIAIEEILLAVPRDHPVNAHAISSMGLPYMELVHVKNEPFILQPQQQKIAKMQNRILAHAGFTPNVVYETLNWDTVHALTCCGLGVSFLPEILMVTPLLSVRPSYYRIAGVDATRPYAVAHRHGKVLSRSAEQLIEILTANLQELKQRGQPQ